LAFVIYCVTDNSNNDKRQTRKKYPIMVV